MPLPVWLDNLIAYSLQIAILATAGVLFAYVFRLRVPRVSLFYWQMLLLVCLLLPALQTWKHPVQLEASAISNTIVYDLPEEVVAASATPSFFTIPEFIGLAIVSGACLRMIWLVFGCFRLRGFLRRSEFLSAKPPIGESLASRIGIQARFFLSDEIDCPATFGFIAPTVILPGSFSGMTEACRESIVCHELLHVRRRDWAVILIEEFIRSIYWFHPAVWWLLGKIHLAREQSVDHEVVRLTGSRQPYLDSLLEIARSRGRPKAVPAPLFLKERHLVQRVALLLKEASMNRIRLAISLAGIAVLLAGTVHLTAGWFPLTGAPAVVQDEATETQNNASQQAPIRAGNKVLESKLIQKVDPEYPEPARRARVSGNVTVLVTVNEAGDVSDAQVVKGHPLLNDAAVAAVKQWKYSQTLLNGKAIPVKATVTVVFALENDTAAAGIGGGIGTGRGTGVGQGSGAGVGAGSGGGTGSGFVRGEMRDAQSVVGGGASKRAPIRAGNEVMESRLIRKVDPVYPELAKRVRVSGEVKLMVTVNEEGFVSDAEVISGHPFLTDAAVEAVRQWQYSPTLLNGKPVAVVATVTVVFALQGDKAETGSGSNAPEWPPEEYKNMWVPGAVVAGRGGENPSAIVEGNDSRKDAVRVGSRVMESKLIRKVDPVYPEPAKRARVSGNVIVQVTVNEAGDVSDAQVVNGHPLLNDAAIAAVRQWKYNPTLLDGNPISVVTTVTVIFALK